MFGPSKKQLWRQIREERAQHRVEIQGLLDRVADLSGRPWTLPPRPVEARVNHVDEIDRDYGPLEEL